MMIALTGATGFLGQQIVQHLDKQGHELRCLVRNVSSLLEPGHIHVLPVRGDLEDPSSLAYLVEGCDVVIHAAAWHDGPFQQVLHTHPMVHFQTNVLGSLRLLELAREQASQFIFISSGAVYGEPPGNDILTGDSPRNPTDGYGAYKAAIEMFCQAYAAQLDFNACVLRPFAIAGLHDPVPDSLFYEIVQGAVAGGTIEARGVRKYVLAEDVTAAITFLLGRKDTKGQIYNLCNGWVPTSQIARWAADAAGVQADIIAAGPGHPQHEVSTQKIQSLGFRFSPAAVLQATIQQMAQHAAQTRLHSTSHHG